MDKNNKYYIEYLKKNYLDRIKKTHDIELLKKLYEDVKNNIYDFFQDGILTIEYEKVKLIIELCEREFKNESLVDIDKKIDLENVELKSDYNNEEVLEYIVSKTRKYLLEKEYHIENYKNIDLNELDFANLCPKASGKVKAICNTLEIENKLIEITPGYFIQALLFNGHKYHYSNIITLGKDKYLVDVTYKQFFNAYNNCLGRIGLVDYDTPQAGIFMLMKKSRIKVAEELLFNGYIKLNSRVFKDYLDGFTISFRNGLYYQNTNDYSYTTFYTKDDYIRFLNGEDNQFCYEDYNYLGYQEKPIQKHKLNII